jgi:membrane protein DedA with SNARE-associated domain/rhodanese-related sulfurtransferase
MDLVDLVTRWGVPLIVIAVLLEQGGLPLPAAPLLVVSGALADIGTMRADVLLGAAVFACLMADNVWFWLGRSHGRRVLATVCRMSLSPDTCVRQTDDLIRKHGAPLLLVAKFIPGVSAVAIPSSAASGLSYRRFIVFDILGAVAWSGAYLGAGMIFSREVNRLLDRMSVIGSWSLVIFGAAIGSYVLAKILQRRRLKRLHQLVRISPAELADLLESDPEALIVDARSQLAREQDTRAFRRSVVLGDRTIVEIVPLEQRGRTIVTFCTCPNEASAALLAEQLIKAGYERVRVLTGGEEALRRLAS